MWNGQNSNWIINYSKGNQTVTSSVSTYFQNNKFSVGAIVNFSKYGPEMFLGYAFFNPGVAGVVNTYYSAAQAVMIMHEAIHLLGPQFGDARFGGSKELTQRLVTNCISALRNYLGGLVF